MPFDLEFWRQWEGQTVDAVFPLGHCIGAGIHGAAFETEFQGQPAAIKLVPGALESSDSLSHPALIRTFARGQTSLDDLRCSYIVMERAEENLAEVLRDRVLSPAEAREMLVPLLAALRYLHAQGFAHGALKPANIMAVGDQLKVSSDGLVRGGDPIADCAAIPMLLEEVLGDDPPEPFAGIVKNGRSPDPSARWDIARIEASMGVDSAPRAPAKSKARWWGLSAAVAVILGLIVFWPSRTKSPAPPPKPAPVAVDVESKPSPLATPPKAPAKVPKKASPERAGQVLPDIPQAALNTITGRVRVNVRVRVDSAGNVSQATLEPPAVSKYFTDRVLAAARAWKFPAGDAPREWGLHFDLMREGTRASSSRIE